MNKEKFDSRSGCLDYGNSYEFLISAYYCLTLSLNEKVADFKISTNNDDMGSFDDVVIEIDYEDGDQHLYALQLKHSAAKGKNIKCDAFDATDGDFSLMKYFKGFKETKAKCQNNDNYSIPFNKFHFVLYTNQVLPRFHAYENRKKVDANEVKLKSGVTVCKYDKCIARDLLNLSEADSYYIYKFRNNEKSKVDENFLTQFILYTGQKNAQEIECMISKFIWSVFKNCDPNVITQYINFFKFWWRGDFGKFKLTKKDVMLKLSEYVLVPHIPDVNFRKIKHYGKNSALLNESFANFDLSVVQNSTSFVEEVVWGAILFKHFNNTEALLWSQPSPEAENFFSENAKIPISAQGDNIVDRSLKKVYTILWHMDQVPLFVKVSNSSRKAVYSAIKLCENNRNRKKFVLMDEDFDEDEFSDDLKIFQNLIDLVNGTDFYHRFFDNILISIQGRERVSLTNLQKINSQFLEVIEVKDLILMLGNDFVIGENYSNFPKHYVARKIPKIVLNARAIDELENDLFVVSCQQFPKIRFKSLNCDLNKYVLMKQNDIHQYSQKIVILAENICTEQQFAQVCLLNKDKNCHHVKIISNERVEWLQSQGNLNSLRQYQLNFDHFGADDFIEDFQLLEYFTNKVNVLCADPGMGKSVIFKFLKGKSPSHLVVTIDIKDHVKFFKEEHAFSDVFDYLLEIETKDQLTRRVADVFATDKKILFLWDGFDEFPKRCVNNAISVIKMLFLGGYQQWISARSYSKEFLENTFSSFALTIPPFSQEAQKLYIYHHLKEKHNNEEQTEEMISKVNENISSSLCCGYYDYTGIPLQIYMVLEIFLKNPKKYLKELKIVTVTDIYQEFIEGKFEELFIRANVNPDNYLMQKIQRKFKETRMAQYEIAAVKATFAEEIFSWLNLNCDNFLQSIADSRDNLGLMFVSRSDGKPKFAHKTYQEYLAASWLSKNCKQYPDVTRSIFKEDYRNVRLMFDMILAKDSDIHIAVLYQNLDVLENYQDDNLKIKDKGGRTPLHVACSWGRTHPLVDIFSTETDKTLICVNHISDSANSSDEIVKYLLSHGCDPFEKDGLVGWHSVQYADTTLSLSSLETIISCKYEISLTELSNFSDVNTVLYYSIKFNYRNLFFQLGSYPYIEIAEGEDTRTILQFAVYMDRLEFVDKLLACPHYQEVVNKPHKDVGSPLYSAASNGNLEMFNLLQEKGAKLGNNQMSPLLIAVASGYKVLCQKMLDQDGMDPNQSFIDDNSLLQIAALRKHVDIVKLLLDRGAQVNNVNCYGHTPLDYAIDARSVEGVRLLLTHGADVNRQINELFGYTSLHNACETGELQIIKLLIEAGADPTVKSKQLYTPLHVALINKHEHVAKYLIGVNSSVINAYSEDKSTPVTLATLENFYDTIELLAKLGADLDSVESNCPPLRIATLRSFDKCVECLIEHGASVNRADKYGFTPIFYSIRNKTILKLFLNNSNTDVNARSHFLVTPLHFASENGESYTVEQLIQHGANINATDRNNETPLHYAIKKRHDNVVKCLVNYGADLNGDLLRFACVYDAPDCLFTLIKSGVDVDFQDVQGRRALHFAANYSLYCTKILIMNGAGVNICDKQGYSPLTVSIYGGQVDIMKELISMGADIKTGFGSTTALHLSGGLGDIFTLITLLNLGCAVNAQDESGRTPLHCVVEQVTSSFFSQLGFSGFNRDFEGCAKELLKRGAFITLKNNLGWTPLLSATYHNNYEMVKLFAKEFGSRDDLKDEWQQCFIGAAAKNYREILQFLYENGLGKIHDADKETEMTGLAYACLGGAYDSVFYLIKNGADVNAPSVDGSTPLFISAFKGYLDLVMLLVEHGAKVDVPNDHGNTALFAAAAEGFLNIVIFLYERGADLNVVDVEGDTPLHDAASRGHVEVVRYLISKKAVLQKNIYGKCPLDVARDNGREELIKILESHITH